MRWAPKLVAAVLGLLLLGGPLWPVAIVCFLYVAMTLRPSRSGIHRRYLLAVALFLLSAAALALGGVLSPVLFALGGAMVLAGPALPGLLPFGEAEPVADSILLRSKYLPFTWYSLAELKPGSEPFPRALSSFTGTLLVFTDTGRTYALATCRALGRRAAEAGLNLRLKSIAPGPKAGAFLLPLDSEAAAGVLRQRLSRMKLPSGDISRHASGVSGVLLLECIGATVQRAGAYRTDGPGSSAKVPLHRRELESPQLLWEVFDEVGKRTPWPDPDTFSSFLDSLAATKGVPIADRLKALEPSGSDLSVQSLGGAEVRVTRPQLRALISLYS